MEAVELEAEVLAGGETRSTDRVFGSSANLTS
jgi:hypothetical protein